MEESRPLSLGNVRMTDIDPIHPDDGDVRKELVARVRREIQDGVYETPEKWEAAVRRLLQEIDSTQ